MDFKIPAGNENLERVRDVFVFCCYSGLRYSDAYNLRRPDLKKLFMEVTTIKKKYELITPHVGRKSFICNCLALGIPVNVVMKWTGHKDYKSMKPYIDVADSIKAREMKKFDKKRR